MINSRCSLYLLIMVSLLFTSCVSQKKYVRVNEQLRDLKLDNTKLQYSLEAQGVNIKKQLDSCTIRFDSIVNNIVDTANSRVALMNKQYISKMANQILVLSSTISSKYKILFKKQIEEGLVSLQENGSSVTIMLNIDKLYDTDSLVFNARGKEILAELATDQNVRRCYVTAKNFILYENLQGQRKEAKINSSVLSDVISIMAESSVAGEYAEELPDSLNKYISQRIDLQLSFGYENLERPYFTFKAQNGHLVEKEKASAVDSASAYGYGYWAASLHYGDDRNIKFVLNPSDYLIGRFGHLTEAEVVRKIQILERKPRSRILRVEGLDKVEGICNNRKAVIILSMDNKLLKSYSGRRFECDTDIINFN